MPDCSGDATTAIASDYAVLTDLVDLADFLRLSAFISFCVRTSLFSFSGSRWYGFGVNDKERSWRPGLVEPNPSLAICFMIGLATSALPVVSSPSMGTSPFCWSWRVASSPAHITLLKKLSHHPLVSISSSVIELSSSSSCKWENITVFQGTKYAVDNDSINT